MRICYGKQEGKTKQKTNLIIYDNIFQITHRVTTTNCCSEILMLKFESSRPEVFCKKGVLRNLAKFTGEHLCQSLF